MVLADVLLDEGHPSLDDSRVKSDRIKAANYKIETVIRLDIVFGFYEFADQGFAEVAIS